MSIEHAVAKYPELMDIHDILENLVVASEKLDAAEEAVTAAAEEYDVIHKKIDEFITAGNP